MRRREAVPHTYLTYFTQTVRYCMMPACERVVLAPAVTWRWFAQRPSRQNIGCFHGPRTLEHVKYDSDSFVSCCVHALETPEDDVNDHVNTSRPTAPGLTQTLKKSTKYGFECQIMGSCGTSKFQTRDRPLSKGKDCTLGQNTSMQQTLQQCCFDKRQNVEALLVRFPFIFFAKTWPVFSKFWSYTVEIASPQKKNDFCKTKTFDPVRARTWIIPRLTPAS